MRDLGRTQLSLDEIVVRRADADPNVIAMIVAERAAPVTIGELRNLAGAAAARLADWGVGPGDRIAVWGQNSIAWAAWLVGAAWRGAAVAALHPGLAADDFAASLAQARASWLIVDESARGRSLAAIAEQVVGAPQMPGLRGMTVLPGGDGLLDLASAIDLGAPPPPRVGRPDVPLNLQFTSGSTGRPKAVVLTHQALIINAAATADAAGIVAGDVLASPLPLFHAAGLSSGLVLSLVCDTVWCTSHRFQADVTLGQIQRHDCTVLQGVPTMFKAIVDLVGEIKSTTPSLRVGFIGGAPCPPDLCRSAIDALNLKHMAIVYGQTEFGPTISLTTGAEPPALALNSVGPPLPGMELAIVDAKSGAPVANGESGEIRVRGPTIMQGYLGDPAATAATITADGWLCTGDLGRLVDGCLQVTGRLKELIIRGGENVSPYEIEDVLRLLPDLADVCVVGAPSAHWGEEICAVLMPQPGGRIDTVAAQQLCTTQLARFKRPDRYIVRDQLPTLPSGKIDRRAIRDAVVKGDWA